MLLPTQLPTQAGRGEDGHRFGIAPLGCGPNGAGFGVPYPAFEFSTIDNIYDAGLAHYNSLQIKAEPRVRGAAFTRSSDTPVRGRTTPASPTVWEVSSGLIVLSTRWLAGRRPALQKGNGWGLQAR